MNRRTLLLLVLVAILGAAALGVVAVIGTVKAVATPHHNAAGGYIEACGDLPGLVGDDC